MVLIYILSILSLSSLFIEKTQLVQVNQAEGNSIVNTKIVSKPQNTKNSNQVNPWLNENDLAEVNTENMNTQSQNSEDEYEEIIFHDDFDKEYRRDVDDNYLDD